MFTVIFVIHVPCVAIDLWCVLYIDSVNSMNYSPRVSMVS